MTNTIVKTGMKIADIFNVTTNIKGMVIGNIIKAIPKLIPDFDPTCTMNLTEYDISPISNKFELKFTATNPNNEVIWLIKTSVDYMTAHLLFLSLKMLLSGIISHIAWIS